jgi:hypothetical protein
MIFGIAQEGLNLDNLAIPETPRRWRNWRHSGSRRFVRQHFCEGCFDRDRWQWLGI